MLPLLPTSTAEAMANLLDYVRHDPAARTPEAVEAALAASLANGDAQAAAAVGQGMFASPRLEEVAAQIAAPTLVVWGAEDRLFPPAIADLVVGLFRRVPRERWGTLAAEVGVISAYRKQNNRLRAAV